MENIKKNFNKFIKYLKFLIKKTLLKLSNKTNYIFNKLIFLIKSTVLKLSNKTNYIFNKLIFLIKKTVLKLSNKTNYIFNKLIFLIKKTALKNSNKTNNIFNKSKSKFRSKLKVSNFNIYLIGLITILFIYLFYLTIPALYNKSWVQNTIESKLLDEFKINFSISSEINYEILPSPHFTIKNAKILNDDPENPKELSEIKELKVFIYQKNLFNKNNLTIKKVLIKNANFLVQKNDFNFFDRLFNKKFSKKEILIKKSNLFFKDINQKTLSIIKMSNLHLFYDNSKLLNMIYLKGEVFKIPFKLKFNKDLINNENNFLLNSKKYKIKIKNKTNYKKKIVNGLNDLSILNSRLITDYKLKKNFLSFKSFNSQISNNKIKYNGKLNLNPFDLTLDISSQKINLMKLFNTNSLLFEFIKSGKLFHDNLNVAISFSSPDISNNKIFDSLKVNLNAINGEINFDSSYILSNKIGLLKSYSNELILNKDNLIFNGDFNLDIKNSDYFFSFFQTSKKYRKPIKNISFNLTFNFFKNRFKINNFKIDNKKPGDEIEGVLNNFNLSEDQQIGNLIIFKNLVNNLFSIYSG